MPPTINELLISIGFFRRSNVFTLQVLCDRHFLCFFVRKFGYDSRNFFQTSNNGSTVSAFAKDNLVTVCVCNRTHGDRLQYALLLDAFRKFVQTCFIETLARIVVTRLNVCH